MVLMFLFSRGFELWQLFHGNHYLNAASKKIMWKRCCLWRFSASAKLHCELVDKIECCQKSSCPFARFLFTLIACVSIFCWNRGPSHSFKSTSADNLKLFVSESSLPNLRLNDIHCTFVCRIYWLNEFVRCISTLISNSSLNWRASFWCISVDAVELKGENHFPDFSSFFPCLFHQTVSDTPSPIRIDSSAERT